MIQTQLLNDLPSGPGFIEDWARKGGFPSIAGVDEAGRGCWAGPVFAAAVILPERFDLPDLDDSKTLSHADRDALYSPIKEQAVAWAVAQSSCQDIESLNILGATLKAMKAAVEQVCARVMPSIVVVDGTNIIPGLAMPQRAWVRGDHPSYAIAAASILAKVSRDRLMEEMDLVYPGYAFSSHKGYGTAAHRAALDRLGPCPIHRRGFKPIAAMLRSR